MFNQSLQPPSLVSTATRMHRGIYSYDVGIAASDSLDGVAGAKGKKREQQLLAKVVPQWVIAAPRAAALAYVARLNEMLRVASSHSHMSAAALLFDVSPLELEVSIPTSLAGFTVSQVCGPRARCADSRTRCGLCGQPPAHHIYPHPLLLPTHRSHSCLAHPVPAYHRHSSNSQRVRSRLWG